MPKPFAQKVSCSGIFTVPPSASASKTRRPSSRSSNCSDTENPPGVVYHSGGASEPMITLSPSLSSECITRPCCSGGMCSAMGVSP